MALRDLRLDPRLHLRQLLDRLRTSLWVTPTVASLLALALTVGLLEVDEHVKTRTYTLVFRGGPESARQLLSTIATSMLTFTALVFSITILVLQLASNQFSPRVVRTFLQERVTKLAMGMFVGTFVYSVLVLSQVRSEPGELVPEVATFAALVLVLASVGVFIRYIHRMTHAIRAISVVSTIARDTRRIIDREFCDRPRHLPRATERVVEGPADRVFVNNGSPGVLTFVDVERLVELAREQDAVLVLLPRIGDFLPRGAPWLRVWGEVPREDACCAAIALDIERTLEQDPAFGLRQLVDIAVRALSPGTNDPSTAAQALDYIHDILRDLTLREWPPCEHRDADGAIRLVARSLDYGDYVRLAMQEIRMYGATAIQVRQRLAAIASDLLSIAPPARRSILDDELRRLDIAEEPEHVTRRPRETGS